MPRYTDLTLATIDAREKGNGIHKIVRVLPSGRQYTGYIVLDGGLTTEEMRVQRETVMSIVHYYFDREELVSYSFDPTP